MMLDNKKAGKVYTKLLGWFKIDTPLGDYNPDWAVLVNCDGPEGLFFVVESKGSTMINMLRPAEKAMIDCGREHFKALGSDVEFTIADRFGTFMDKCSKEQLVKSSLKGNLISLQKKGTFVYCK